MGRRRVSARLFPAGLLLAGLLAACAPTTSQPTPNVILIPGGTIRGRWVEWGTSRFPLPAPPLLAAANGDALYVAYADQLLFFRGGTFVESFRLSTPPRFLHAFPEAVVGLANELFVPGAKKRFPYPARDARVRKGVWWTDGDAWYGDRKLASGRFRIVVADDTRVAFLGKEAFFPGIGRFPIPRFHAAALASNLYLLTDEGLVAYTPTGLRIARRPGAYLALAARAGEVWVLDRQGERIHLNPYLEETP